MNDPWDVKSVRQSGQYLSCMKINGVPLLPPVLSKECRKEMQYYKLLAKEVEKRIALLKPYTIDSDTEGDEDITDAPDLPESEQVSGMLEAVSTTTSPVKSLTESPKGCLVTVQQSIVEYNNLKPKDENPPNSKYIMDLTLDRIGANRNSLDSKKSPQHSPTTEVPERDCETPKKIKEKKQLLTDVESNLKCNKQALIDTVNNFIDDILSDPFHELSSKQDGPSSLSTKSFTGSLNDLHTDSLKESHKGSKLIRQSSYTLLKPSPQLLAHLEVQSLNTGVEMTSISMSESLSNLSSPNKKRRSWDLESAKVKWSSMALELNKKNVPKENGINKNLAPRCAASPKKLTTSSPQVPRAKSVTQEKPRRVCVTSKTMPKSEPTQKVIKRPLSPVRNVPSTMSNRSNVKEAPSPKNTSQKKDAQKPLISESDDPASRVRELYEKIQKQQLAQMTNLVEKQKREQMLLQQVFEEQNNILYKQLKTICPKSPIEAKEAWVDKVSDGADRGPVSLSQLINQKSPDQSVTSPVSSTLTETHGYINHCDEVLKKSRDITGGLKKQQHIPRSQSSAKMPPKSPGEGTRTRTQSPSFRNASRRLNYDTSVSSDRECEPILTDRTNDTLADLNVTFPSDYSDNEHSSKRNGIPNSRPDTGIHPSTTNSTLEYGHIDAAIRNMEESLYNSINSKTRLKPQAYNNSPTAKEREAATKIVAHAKGFLVRRLMRTERVQSTVQTIKDALLCALQLHQDRDGIRGADVDLHRRLIQQITAACYTLHDTFVASTPAERCAVLAADRSRKRALATRATPVPRPRSGRNSDIMSQSHSGSFPTRSKRQPASPMTQSNYETFSSGKLSAGSSYVPSPQRRPWR